MNEGDTSNVIMMMRNVDRTLSYTQRTEPTCLQEPVVVSYFKQKQIRPQEVPRRRRWRAWRLRKPQYECIGQRFNICRWYKKQRALKSLKDENKKEQKEKLKKRREEYERERINDILRWEYGKQQKRAKEDEQRIKREEHERERVNYIINLQYEEVQKAATKYEPKMLWTLPAEEKKEIKIKKTKYKPNTSRRSKKIIDVPIEKKTKKKGNFPAEKKPKIKKTYIKDKSANVRPQARTKQVYVKKFKQRASISNRFVNCCYRMCCQFYCCLTCILLITFTIIFIL